MSCFQSRLLKTRLRPALPGLLLAVLTMLLGVEMGIGFGLNEDGIKSRLLTSATDVKETVYKGDDAVFWVWAGLRAPGLGSAGLAKQSLKWLAMPSSGVFGIATLVGAMVIFMGIIRRPFTSE